MFVNFIDIFEGLLLRNIVLSLWLDIKLIFVEIEGKGRVKGGFFWFLYYFFKRKELVLIVFFFVNSRFFIYVRYVFCKVNDRVVIVYFYFLIYLVVVREVDFLIRVIFIFFLFCYRIL